MRELKCIYYEEIFSVFFPSLETLNLQHCLNFRGWQRLGDRDHEANNIDNKPSLPRLFSLAIYGCPNLICMPTLSHHNSVKCMMEICLADSPFEAKHLRICQVKEVEAMAEDWMQNLTSLEQLSLRGSSITPPLLRQLQHLPFQLQQLNIREVIEDELVLWEGEHDDSTRSHGPPHTLRSLQILSIDYCYNMKALPEQIGGIQSLQHIQIIGCDNLESLPEAMRCLTNLQTLHIYGCPLLRDRCQAETGQDWPNIAHIPNINIFQD